MTACLGITGAMAANSLSVQCRHHSSHHLRGGQRSDLLACPFIVEPGPHRHWCHVEHAADDQRSRSLSFATHDHHIHYIHLGMDPVGDGLHHRILHVCTRLAIQYRVCLLPDCSVAGHHRSVFVQPRSEEVSHRTFSHLPIRVISTMLPSIDIHQ